MPGPLIGGSARPANGDAHIPTNSVFRYGFDTVFEEMKKEPGLLETVVGRLTSPDSVMALNR